MKKYIILSLLVLIAIMSISSVSSADLNQIVDGLNSTSDINQGLEDAQTNNKSVF